jgi:signal transduction histidine kinase
VTARRRIRVRVTAIAVGITAVVLTVGGVAVVLVEQHVLSDALDRSLDARADDLAAAVRAGGGALTVGDEEDRLAQVVTADGDVIIASPELQGQPPLAPGVVPGTSRRATITGVGGDRFRLLSRGVETGSTAMTIHVAEDSDDAAEAVGALATSLAIAVAAAVVVLGALVWWLVGRTLRPVEQAAAREARFVSDASHELRSPLTRLRALLEVQLASGDRGADRSALDDALVETEALQLLLDDLLDLARLHGRPPPTAPVDLTDLALVEAERIRRNDVAVDTRGVAMARTVGDAGQLSRAVRNLLDNASRHARSAVSITVQETGDAAVIEVADDGDGVPAGSEEVIFEPFTRIDAARNPNTGRSGLGLAIVRDIVELHHGSVHVERRPPSGTVFVVRLPRAR